MREPVRDYIVENFLFGDPDKLHDETPLLESGIVDSTGVLEIVGFLEDTFGIRVEDDEIVPSNLDSIRNICAYLARKLGS